MSQSMTPYVRVTGIRNGRFVEFQFTLGDPDLSVDLIMPFAAFDEFCRNQAAVVLPSVGGVDVPSTSAPGLYRCPDPDAFPSTH